jgi:hypothetical protein
MDVLVYFHLLAFHIIVAAENDVWSAGEPTFDSSKINVTVVSGGLAFLPCSIENLGRYRVAWLDRNSIPVTYQDRRVINDPRFSIVRKTTKDWHLVIRDVQEDDQGQYRCAINTFPVKSKLVNLFVEDKMNHPPIPS